MVFRFWSCRLLLCFNKMSLALLLLVSCIMWFCFFFSVASIVFCPFLSIRFLLIMFTIS